MIRKRASLLLMYTSRMGGFKLRLLRATCATRRRVCRIGHAARHKANQVRQIEPAWLQSDATAVSAQNRVGAYELCAWALRLEIPRTQCLGLVACIRPAIQPPPWKLLPPCDIVVTTRLYSRLITQR
jgi:hypothetical protein